MNEKENTPMVSEGDKSKKNIVKSFFAKISPDAWLVAVAIILASLFIAAATTSSYKMDGKSRAGAVKQETQNNAVADPVAEQVVTGTTTFDDDPVLGDPKTAKVAIVEFSDYECPFCKQFHAQTHDQLVAQYVKNGKAVLVTRDFPLPFHDPSATMEAGMALYVFQQKGVNAFVSFSQALYENTKSGGDGITAEKLDELIVAQGLDPAAARTFANSDEAKAEVAKDITDGQAAGVEGTPSFVIGTFDDEGKVTGELLVGAQPLTAFEKVLDKYLQ